MGSNLDDDRVAVMEEIDLVNNGLSRADTCELIISKMVDVDG